MSETTKDTDKVQSAEVIPFTVPNKSCEDEVTLLFDDGNKLFVSRGFLCYASPVFDAMFTLEFTEKRSGVVELKEKRYEDFLEFLLTLHPCEQKPITKENVYNVMEFAEEYHVKASIRTCKDILRSVLRDEFKIIKDRQSFNDEFRCTEAALACLQVVSVAALYGHDDLTDTAIDSISNFGSKVYLKDVTLQEGGYQFGIFSKEESWYYDASTLKKKFKKCEECRKKFDALPAFVQNKILRKRLDLTEDDTTR